MYPFRKSGTTLLLVSFSRVIFPARKERSVVAGILKTATKSRNTIKLSTLLEDYAADAKLKFQTCLPKYMSEIVTVSGFAIFIRASGSWGRKKVDFNREGTDPSRVKTSPRRPIPPRLTTHATNEEWGTVISIQ